MKLRQILKVTLVSSFLHRKICGSVLCALNPFLLQRLHAATPPTLDLFLILLHSLNQLVSSNCLDSVLYMFFFLILKIRIISLTELFCICLKVHNSLFSSSRLYTLTTVAEHSLRYKRVLNNAIEKVFKITGAII